MALLLGIMGKSGSGKNFIASLLEKRGWRTLDLDKVAHEVLDLIARSLADRFGSQILTDEGRVNRRVLGLFVFSDPDQLAALEKMTYPLIVERTEEWLASGASASAIHAVNLHKTSLPERCAAILWVRAPFLIRRLRVINRDKMAWKDVKGRFGKQKGLNPKLLLSRAETYNVGNFGTLRHIERRLDHVLKSIEVQT